MLLRNFCLLLTLLTCAPLYSQVPGMKVYGRLDGFPGSVGYMIHQDSLGFIWVGTDNGAVCFDGRKFKVLDEQSGLTDKEIIAALPGRDSVVFLIPLLNNIAIYRNGKLVSTAAGRQLGKVKNTQLNSALCDPVTQHIWLADGDTRGSIYKYAHDSLQRFSNPPGKSDMFKVINDQAFFTRTEESGIAISVFDTRNNTHHQLLENGRPLILPSAFVTLSDDGRYLAMHGSSRIMLYEISGFTATMISSFVYEKSIKEIIIDRNDRLWTLLEGEGVEYFGSIRPGLAAPYFSFLENTSVNGILVDRDNNTWFTTHHKGLYFISARHWENALLSRSFAVDGQEPWSIGGDDQERIYIGHYARPQVSVIGHVSRKEILLDTSSYQGVRCILNFGGDMLVTERSNLHRLHAGPGGDLRRETFITTGTIKDIAAFGDSAVLIASHADALLLDLYGKPPLRLMDGRSTCIESFPGKKIMIGTPNGLYEKQSLTAPAVKVSDPLLSQANITDIVFNGSGHALVGTNGQGIYSYELGSGKVRRIGTPGSNINGVIYRIFMQNDSIAWLATDRGAFRVLFDRNCRERSITNYTFFDGLPSDNVMSVFVKNDTAYMATIAGLGIVPLLDNGPKLKKTPLIYVNAAGVEGAQLFFPLFLQLEPWQKELQLSLSAISFESIGNVKYRYQLLGLSDRWIETENAEIRFSGLAPGDYQLRVYAIDHKGVRSGVPYLLTIIVKPAYWQTWWFRSAVGVLLVAALFAVIYGLLLRKNKQQFKVQQQKRRLAELELEAIKAQINPHFIFNCLNSIQYFTHKQELGMVKHYLDLFAKLIRQTMLFSQETFISLEQETEYLNNYLDLEKMRFKERLTYSVNIEKGLNSNMLVPAMLVQPYVENALKHGISKIKEQGRIDISFSRAENGWLKATIADNGPGLPALKDPDQRTHMGMRLSAGRANSYNQLFQLRIKVSTGTPSTGPGTIVNILIPPISDENSKVPNADH